LLTFVDHDTHRGSRRSFLRFGGAAAIGAAGMPLPGLSALRSALDDAPGLLTGKSVIFLFLHGGPSQFETFDPKMTMPAEIRSATGQVATRIPGITFGSSFPRLATLADRLAVVRSYVPGDPNHDLKPLVGRDTFGANVGCAYSRVAGPNHPRTGLPTNIALFPRAVDATTMEAITAFGRFDATGPFSPSDAPFDASRVNTASDDLKLTIARDRLDDRRLLLQLLDDMARRIDRARATQGVDRLRDQAYGLLTGGLAEAFDINKEDPRLVARYDTAPLVRPDTISRTWKNYNHYVDNAKSLGRLLLLARRLCERGCGFVTVTTSFVWDMHADENNAPMEEGMRYMGLPLDYALSALVEDIHARGLQDKILVVACGEMGRTPRLNAKGGRDHWGNLGPLLLCGGGLPMGCVIGRSNRDGSAPESEPVTPKHLVATLLHALFDVGQLRLVPNLPREFAQTAASWQPITDQ
jgi:hypothetical protein